MVDALETVKTLLNTNWSSSNTDSLTPTIVKAAEVKQIFLANGDYIKLYEVNESITALGLGAQAWTRTQIVSADILSTYKVAAISDVRAHAIKLKDEFLRIIYANVNAPGSDYKRILPISKKDLSDKTTGISRFTIDMELVNWGSS